MHIRTLVVALVGLTASTPLIRAQVSDELPAARRAGEALARLQPGQRVRVEARALGLVEGAVDSTSSRSVLVVRTGASAVSVPASGIDTLWVHGSHWARGMLVGGAVGGVGFGALVAAVNHSFCEELSGCNDVGAFFGGLVVGATAGLVIGGIVGSGFGKWHVRFP